MRGFGLLILACICALIAWPQAAWAIKDIDLIDVYAFDPEAGQDYASDKFTWPIQDEVAFLIKYQTAGYSGREQLRIFAVLRNNTGDVLFKHTQEHVAGTGHHMIVLDKRLMTTDAYGKQELTLTLEVALADEDRVSTELDFILLGPQPPAIAFTDIDIWNPNRSDSRSNLRETGDKAKDKLEKGIKDIFGAKGGDDDPKRDDTFYPGEEFAVEVEFDVDDNQTTVKPRVYAFASVQDESGEWPVEPFSGALTQGEYWDVRELEHRDGKWTVRVEGWTPEAYMYTGLRAQYFKVYVWVVFGPGAMKFDSIKGKVQQPDAGFAEAATKQDRQVIIDRAYTWGVDHE